MKLYHGTKRKYAESILRNGFDRPDCKSDYQNSGCGTYFFESPTSGSMDEYAGMKDGAIIEVTIPEKSLPKGWRDRCKAPEIGYVPEDPDDWCQNFNIVDEDECRELFNDTFGDYVNDQKSWCKCHDHSRRGKKGQTPCDIAWFKGTSLHYYCLYYKDAIKTRDNALQKGCKLAQGTARNEDNEIVVYDTEWLNQQKMRIIELEGEK